MAVPTRAGLRRPHARRLAAWGVASIASALAVVIRCVT